MSDRDRWERPSSLAAVALVTALAVLALAMLSGLAPL